MRLRPFAQQDAGAAPPPDQQALAQKLANPVSDLVSVPFQFNWEQNVGPNDQTRFVLNVQPVMPFSLNDNWNLTARVIMPSVSRSDVLALGRTGGSARDSPEQRAR